MCHNTVALYIVFACIMKRKIALLITGCIITVAALACIQGYFIFNTYKLYAKEADGAIRQQLLKLETTGKFDTINAVWMENTSRFMDEYHRGQSTKEQYKTNIAKISDSLSKVMSRFIIKERFFEGYNVSYSNYIDNVILFRDCQKEGDTLFSEKILLYGNNTENAEELDASQSNWHGSIPQASPDDVSLDFEVITKRSYSIANWQTEVAAKMVGLLIFTGALLAFVVVLFYFSIKNLITQKKTADIKTDFVNNITHEFQTPIAAMDIAVKTLQRKEQELTPDQFNNTLSIISRQNQRMQKLFSQVTQASVATDVIPTSHAEALNCNDIKQIVHDFMLSGPNVTIHCPNGNATIYIDRFHLATLLINLLDNAVKYGGSNITIALEDVDGNAVLSVTDDGMGIPQKEKTVIFDKFYRVQKGNIHNTKGLGLGLHYVRQITEAYKGSVAVTGDEGHGSTFTLSIPLA